ncbi:MAG: hypothetical protein NTZ51_08040 [Proteobacteria bacterium]|nr:hypothetical protein [Pseudomonadota bacterium]
MDKSIKKNRRKVQLRNYWAYHNRRKSPQPKGGYENICQCGKAVEFCPECDTMPDSDTSGESDFLE